MVKRAQGYLIVSIMFIIAACGTYWARSRPTNIIIDADVNAIPKTVGVWSRFGEDMRPSQEVLDAWAVSRNDFLQRRYVNPLGESLDLLVVYKGEGRRDWHLPEMCFRGSGYELVSETRTTVPFGGREIPAVKLIGQSDKNRQIILYWFVAGNETEVSFSRLQLSMALSRLKPRKYGWTFIRVNGDVKTTDDDALMCARGFLRSASNPIVKALTVPGEKVPISKR